MTGAAHLIKTAHAGRIADELLRSPVGFLAGVSAEIEATLATLDIRTIFDLATSRTFAAAERLLVAERDPASVDARLNAVPADVVDAPAGVSAAALARQPIGILRRIGPSRGPETASVLGTPTVRDLALWPAYQAAKQILGEAFFPDRQPSADLDAPADLLPSTGMHPTERVFYRRLLIDTSPPDTANLAPIENADAIDLVPGLLDPRGFDRLATGALLTFSQSWFSQGLTLGQLLHSTSLAPGESTRIAMVDWSRRTRAAATEDIAETEQLSNVQTHNRALSEVTSATATEVQQGRSEIHGTSASGEAGLGLGLDIGPLGFSASGAATTTDVMTSTSSFGVRDVAAEFAQTINDRTQQHASSARSRRASIVREVSQQEHETISTRVVTNYNHMHALTVQYYEIVQAFRVTTELARAERCLFVPLQLVDFSRPGVIEQWRDQLARSALTPSIARLLVEFGTVRVTSQQPWRPPVVAGGEVAATTSAGVARAAASSATPAAGETTSAAPAPARPEPVARDRIAAAPASASIQLEKAGWNVEQIAQLGQVAGRLRVSPRTRSISVSDAAVVVSVALRRGRALRFSVRRRDGIRGRPPRHRRHRRDLCGRRRHHRAAQHRHPARRRQPPGDGADPALDAVRHDHDPRCADSTRPWRAVVAAAGVRAIRRPGGAARSPGSSRSQSPPLFAGDLSGARRSGDRVAVCALHLSRAAAGPARRSTAGRRERQLPGVQDQHAGERRRRGPAPGRRPCGVADLPCPIRARSAGGEERDRPAALRRCLRRGGARAEQCRRAPPDRAVLELAGLTDSDRGAGDRGDQPPDRARSRKT